MIHNHFAIFPSCSHVYIVDKVFSKRTSESVIEVNIEKERITELLAVETFNLKNSAIIFAFVLNKKADCIVCFFAANTMAFVRLVTNFIVIYKIQMDAYITMSNGLFS